MRIRDKHTIGFLTSFSIVIATSVVISQNINSNDEYSKTSINNFNLGRLNFRSTATKFNYVQTLDDILSVSSLEEVFIELAKTPNLKLEYLNGQKWINFTSSVTINERTKISVRLNADNLDPNTYSFDELEVKTYVKDFEVVNTGALTLTTKVEQYKKDYAVLKITPPTQGPGTGNHYEYATFDSTLTKIKSYWNPMTSFAFFPSTTLATDDKIRIRVVADKGEYPILEKTRTGFLSQEMIIPTLVDASNFNPTIDPKTFDMTATNLITQPNTKFQYKVDSKVKNSTNSLWNDKMPKSLLPGDILWTRYESTDKINHPVDGIVIASFYVMNIGTPLIKLEVDASNFKPTMDIMAKKMTGTNLKVVQGTNILYSVIHTKDNTVSKPSTDFPTTNIENGDTIIAQYVPKDPNYTVVASSITASPISYFQIKNLARFVNIDATKISPIIDTNRNMTNPGVTIPIGVVLKYAVQKKGGTKGNFSTNLPQGLSTGDKVFFKYESTDPSKVALKGIITYEWTMKAAINVDASSFAPTIDLKKRLMIQNNLPKVKGTKILYSVLDNVGKELSKPSTAFPTNLFNGNVILAEYVSEDLGNNIIVGIAKSKFIVSGITEINIETDLSNPNVTFLENGTFALGKNVLKINHLFLEFKVIGKEGQTKVAFTKDAPTNLSYGDKLVLKYVGENKTFVPTGISISDPIPVKFVSSDSNSVLLYGGIIGGSVVGLWLILYSSLIILKNKK